MKNTIILIFTFLATIQISNVKNNKLKPDELAKEVFTSKELKGIMTMIKYVDDLLVEKKN